MTNKSNYSEKMHVGRPNIGNRDKFLARVNEMLDNRWFTNNGPLVQEFENKLSDYLGVKHCIAMCNATIALEITTRALELKGEVIVPAFTFIATAHCLQWQEITPVFCDISPETHLIDIEKIEKMITPRTTGIIGVHLWGQPCNVEALGAIAKKHKLKLIFDAAHAFGCSYKGRMIGNFAEAEVFSFHATKFFNTFEGGLVATNNDALAEKIRLMQNFGFSGYDNVIYIGTNGKMTEVCAAMGLTNLEAVDDFININKRNYMTYKKQISSIPGLRLIEYSEPDKKNFQYIVVIVDESICGINRDELVEILHANNVIARRYFYPGCHRMEPYRSYFPHAHLLLPETELLSRHVLLLPTGTSVSQRQIKNICGIIAKAICLRTDLISRRKSAKCLQPQI